MAKLDGDSDLFGFEEPESPLGYLPQNRLALMAGDAPPRPHHRAKPPPLKRPNKDQWGPIVPNRGSVGSN